MLMLQHLLLNFLKILYCSSHLQILSSFKILKSGTQ